MFDDSFPMMLEREAGLPENYPAVAVGFGMYPQLNKAKTAEAGHDVYDEREYVRVVVPGDKASLLLQPSTDAYRRRFPKAYQAFKTRESGGGRSGMPIEQWAVVSRSVAMTLRAAHVHTVEDLCEVSDSHIDRLSVAGARELQAKARAWLAQAKDGAEAARKAAENEGLQKQIQALHAQIAALAEAKADEPDRPVRRKVA
jgi:hypothetical protein